MHLLVQSNLHVELPRFGSTITSSHELGDQQSEYFYVWVDHAPPDGPEPREELLICCMISVDKIDCCQFARVPVFLAIRRVM